MYVYIYVSYIHIKSYPIFAPLAVDEIPVFKRFHKPSRAFAHVSVKKTYTEGNRCTPKA